MAGSSPGRLLPSEPPIGKMVSIASRVYKDEYTAIQETLRTNPYNKGKGAAPSECPK